MDAAAVLDAVVVAYAAAVCVLMVVLVVMLAVCRADPVVRAHNAPMLALMALGGLFHTASEIVGNRHAAALRAVETAACPLWGYWLPYVAGAGPFFVGLYLRLFTYTTAMTRDLSARGAARARRWRWPVALLTLFPIACVAALVTVTPGASRVDADSDACTSERGYKIAVGAWVAACVLALLTSIAVFRHGYVADVIGEIRKQVFVSAMGVVVLCAVAFVMLFAGDGLDDVANRFVATFSVATLYLWALGVMGARPLWKAVHGDAGYSRVIGDRLELASQPLDSVRGVLDHAADRGAARLLLADFIAYCGVEGRPPIRRDRSGAATAPQAVAAFYAQIDAWTRARAGDDADADGAAWPPLVCGDFRRSHGELVQKYFSHPDLPDFVDVGMSQDVRDAVTRVSAAGGRDPPAGLFVPALWWTLDLLDAHYGAIYLRKDVHGRDVVTSAQNTSVRDMLVTLRRGEAQRRLADADLVGAVGEDA